MTEKRATHKFGRSLIGRVILSVLAFLILPLILYSLYTYRRDYIDRRAAILTSLDYLAQGEILMMQQLLVARFQMLDGLADFLGAGPQLTSALLDKFNENLVGQKKGNEILFIAQNGANFLCRASSNAGQVGHDYTSYIELTREDLPGYLVFAAQDPGLLIDMVYLGKRVEGGYFFLAYPSERMLSSLTILKNAQFPTTLTVIDAQKGVIASSEPRLNRQNFGAQGIVLKAFDGEGWEFTFEGKRRIALMRDVPYTDFSLIFAVLENQALIPIQRVVESFIIPFLILLTMGLIASFLLIRRFARPLDHLAAVMEKVGTGHLQARFTPDPLGYEINRVGTIFNDMIDHLLVQMEARRENEVQKEAYLKELKIGQALQQELLPASLPQVRGISVAARFMSAKEVGGDFYDLFLRPDGLLQIAICDVSDKGIYACFHGLMLRSILRSLGDKSCGEILERANTLFAHDAEKSSTFATLWLGLYDLNQHSLTYSCVGHHPPYLCRRNGELISLQTEGMALGVAETLDYTLGYQDLEEGDHLFLYTDGLVERDNAAGELYGNQRLETFIREYRDLDPERMVATLFEEMDHFGQGKSLPDDLSLLILKRVQSKLS